MDIEVIIWSRECLQRLIGENLVCLSGEYHRQQNGRYQEDWPQEATVSRRHGKLAERLKAQRQHDSRIPSSKRQPAIHTHTHKKQSKWK